MGKIEPEFRYLDMVGTSLNIINSLIKCFYKKTTIISFSLKEINMKNEIFNLEKPFSAPHWLEGFLGGVFPRRAVFLVSVGAFLNFVSLASACPDILVEIKDKGRHFLATGKVKVSFGSQSIHIRDENDNPPTEISFFYENKAKNWRFYQYQTKDGNRVQTDNGFVLEGGIDSVDVNLWVGKNEDHSVGKISLLNDGTAIIQTNKDDTARTPFVENKDAQIEIVMTSSGGINEATTRLFRLDGNKRIYLGKPSRVETIWPILGCRARMDFGANALFSNVRSRVWSGGSLSISMCSMPATGTSLALDSFGSRRAAITSA